MKLWPVNGITLFPVVLHSIFKSWALSEWALLAPALFSGFIPQINPPALESLLPDYAAHDQKLQLELSMKGFPRSVFWDIWTSYVHVQPERLWCRCVFGFQRWPVTKTGQWRLLKAVPKSDTLQSCYTTSSQSQVCCCTRCKMESAFPVTLPGEVVAKHCES